MRCNPLCSTTAFSGHSPFVVADCGLLRTSADVSELLGTFADFGSAAAKIADICDTTVDLCGFWRVDRSYSMPRPTSDNGFCNHRNLNVQPTIKVPIGYRFNGRVNRELLFEAPYRPFQPLTPWPRPTESGRAWQ